MSNPCKHWFEGMVARSETKCPFCEIDELRAELAIWIRRADKTWYEKVYTDEIATLKAKLAAAETSANELRRAVAELIGADPETWPNHGNAPLAIAACIALLTALESKLAALEAQEPIATVVFTTGGFWREAHKSELGVPGLAFPIYAAAGAGHLLAALKRIDDMCSAPPNFSDATIQDIARAAIAASELNPKE